MNKSKRIVFLSSLLLLTFNVLNAASLKVGVIGLDNYQAVAFANLFQTAKPGEPLAGFEVVAAFPGGSPDIPESVQGLPRWTERFKTMGIPFVNSIADVVERADVVILMSLDGRVHLKQATPVLKAGKPLYIGRPMAASLVDVLKIFQLAKAHQAPIFSCSQHRFVPAFSGMRNHPQVGRVLGCSVYGGLQFEPTHADFFWHSIHSAETLFTIMGPGCVSVTRASTSQAELVTGKWKDGRIGTFRGLGTGTVKYSGVVFGEKGILRAGNYGRGVPALKTDAEGEHWLAPQGEYMGYKGVALAMADFFRTRKPPISAAETIEIFAFLEAAHESKRRDGVPVKLETVLTHARSQLKAGKK